jgi:heptosyltransferase-1
MSEGNPAPPGRRLLIILLGALGDVVRGLAVVNAIKRQDPSCHITWLVEPASSGIVSLNPGIDEVIVFQRKEGLRGILSLRRELSARTFDWTLDMQRHLKSGFFSWLSGAPRRIGFHPKDTKEWNWIFNTSYIEARGDGASKIDHYLSFVTALGFSPPDVVDAGLSHITLESLGNEWSRTLHGAYMGVILGSSRYSKDWPLEGYQELLKRFDVPGIESVVLLGDTSKVEMARQLEFVTSAVRIINGVGKTNLRELVGIIHGARACIGPDSGPGHIAGALGVPHVTLFGPTPAGRNAPRRSEGLSVVSSIGCSPCRRRVCPGLDKLCMRLISPDSVLDRLHLAIQSK